MFIQFFQKYLEELWIQNQMYIGAFVFRNLKELLLAPFLFSLSPEKKIVIVDTLLSRSFMNGGYIQFEREKD